MSTVETRVATNRAKRQASTSIAASGAATGRSCALRWCNRVPAKAGGRGDLAGSESLSLGAGQVAGGEHMGGGSGSGHVGVAFVDHRAFASGLRFEDER
jgi:hypothetical protein